METAQTNLQSHDEETQPSPEVQQSQNQQQYSGQEKKNVEVHVNDAGVLADYISHKKFAFFLIGVMLTTFALMIGIYAVIFVLDLSGRIPNVITNKYGVVINTDPNREVSYFLLNSTQHWTPTGIHVNKGDIVTVHSSGVYNTAIHHVIANSKKNKQFDFEWIDADGISTRAVYDHKPADSLSLHYLEAPDANLGTLLMRVQGSNEALPIAVGREQTHIRMQYDGDLEFCINEVYLSPENIRGLQKEYCNYLREQIGKSITSADTTLLIQELEKFEQIIASNSHNPATCLLDKSIDITIPDEACEKVFKRLYELEYYYHENYTTPWYDDNYGSFLVIVEIEKH